MYRLLFFFCWALFYCQLLDAQAPVAKNGWLDLRTTDLHARSVELNGEWTFYWKQILQPGDTDHAKKQYTQYPGVWSSQMQNGQHIASQGYATYTLTILLPRQRQQPGLEIPALYSAYKLYVNGKLLASNGNPSSNLASGMPKWTTEIAGIADAPDTLHLVLQVANFWHSKGGISKAILIGEEQQLRLHYQQDAALDLILAGCLFMGGLFFWGLSVFGRNDKIIFYFSVFCIVTSYRMVGTELYVLHSLFPQLSWFVAIRLEYLSLVLGVALFSQYTRLLFPKDTRQLLMKMVIAFCLLYASIILLLPPLVFTGFLNFFLVIMFFYILYAFYIYVKAVIHKRTGAVYALLSSGIMLMVYFMVNLQYFNLIPETRLVVFAGYIAFFFLQSLVLSHRFSAILQKATGEAQQGLKVKAEFLSTMSHEIRTPLNAVIGMAHLLNRGKPRQDQQEQINVLLFTANNLLSIVNNILDYNKIEAGKISIEQIAMDLPMIAANVIAGLQNLADEKLLQLVLDIDPRLTKKVIGDPTRTSQVLNNLVHNAIKFTKQGSVVLSIRIASLEKERVALEIAVTDTGIGIAPEKQQLIFERFTQADSSTSRSFGGTGLGLSISKKILEMQGTVLQLKSTPGNGSVFYFTQNFALTQEPVAIAAVSGPHLHNDENSLAGVSILLVEDNLFNVMVAQTCLEKCGAIVDVAENGQQALEKFKAHTHRLILMDLDMPVMDGYEATRILRRNGETLPVIALTASLPKEVESEVYAAGLTDIIVKPFNPEELFRIIITHLKAIAA